MRTKVTLGLVFLNVVLFLFIFYFERSWRTERVAMEVRRRVLGAEAADIRALDVAAAGSGISFSLERRGDTWFLSKPFEWPANPHAVSRIINDLQFLEHETSFSVRDVEKNGQSLADYGLDHPKLVVTFTSGGPDTTGAPPVTTTLRIGATTKVGQRLYLLSSDETRIHVVGRELAESLLLPLEQLRADTLLTIPVFEARSLSLQTAPSAGVRVLVQRDGNRWSFETPITGRASKDAVELAINGLDALRVKSFVTTDLPVRSPKDWPDFTVSIEGNNRRETLFFGQEVPGADSSGGNRVLCAQLEHPDAVFTIAVPFRLLEVLRNAQETLRDRRVLDFDPSLVTVITLRAPNEPDLTLQRLEAGASTSESGWQIVLRGDSTQGPSTLPADRTAVQRLIDQLALLSAEQFKSDAPQASDLENWGFNRPEREITLTLQPSAGLRTAGSPFTLQIGRATQRDPYVYARLAHALSVYGVSPDILNETPVAPLAWRDRLLLSLPEAAKITAITLTDLPSGKAILEWTAASDKAEMGARSDAAPDNRRLAVQSVIEHLRMLRALRFTRDGFSEGAAAGGEELPWKYRLDATVALPGGAGGEQTSVRRLWFAERTGGGEQIAGSPDFGVEFALEQPLIDALWTLTYGDRDPGPARAPTH